MDKAGWTDVWHMIVAIVARQPPFLAILMVLGAVFVAVMALEGLRTSLLAIRRAHRGAPSAMAEKPVALAAPAPAVNRRSPDFPQPAADHPAPSDAGIRRRCRAA